MAFDEIIEEAKAGIGRNVACLGAGEDIETDVLVYNEDIGDHVLVVAVDGIRHDGDKDALVAYLCRFIAVGEWTHYAVSGAAWTVDPISNVDGMRPSLNPHRKEQVFVAAGSRQGFRVHLADHHRSQRGASEIGDWRCSGLVSDPDQLRRSLFAIPTIVLMASGRHAMVA